MLDKRKTWSVPDFDMSEFFSMGGYGFYVWGSYGVTFALLAIELVLLRKRQKR